MQAIRALLLLVAGRLHASAENAEVNPIAKTIELLASLKLKIIADGEAADRTYQKYAEWCGRTSRDAQNEIDTATKSVEKLTAKATRHSSDIEVTDTKIEELSSSISEQGEQVSDATEIRKKEAEEFVEAEKELMTTIDTLERAISVLEKNSASGGSLAQIDTTSMTTLLQSLSAVADAAALSGEGRDRLSSLFQTEESSDDAEESDDDGIGAPAATKYEKKSGSIVEVMQDMKDKAESQLADLRKHEVNAKHSYQMLKQSLDHGSAADTKELDQQKSAKAQSEEDKASTEDDLVMSKKAKEEAEKKYDELKSTCQVVASDYEENVAARKLELDRMEEARKILEETTGGAEDQLYTPEDKEHPGGAECHALSFVQVASKSGVPTRAVEMVQTLARQHHSKALAQLASKISATMRYQRNGADPFVKVKGLIVQLITKLEKEMSQEAQEKAYCDEEMAKTKDKYDDLEDSVASLTTKIDIMASKSAKLKEEVAELMKELSTMAKAQAESDLLRKCENAAYKQAKADLELGLNGVMKSMTVLKKYYGQGEDATALVQESQDGGDTEQMTSMMQQIVTQPSPPEKFEKSSGAGHGIISVLEVIDSDFSKNLATEETKESDSQSSYDKTTEEFKISKAKKEQDAKYKTQEFKSLEKNIAELSSDKATDEQQLAAVSEYYDKVKERCIANPSKYEELKAIREAEIRGLKEALATLEADAAALQIGKQANRRGHLRGDSLSTD